MRGMGHGSVMALTVGHAYASNGIASVQCRSNGYQNTHANWLKITAMGLGALTKVALP